MFDPERKFLSYLHVKLLVQVTKGFSCLTRLTCREIYADVTDVPSNANFVSCTRADMHRNSSLNYIIKLQLNN